MTSLEPTDETGSGVHASAARIPPAPGTALVPVVPAIRRRLRLVGGLSLGAAALGLMLPLLTGAAARVEGHDWSNHAFVVFFGAQLAAVALGAVARRDRLGALGLLAGAVLLGSSLILVILCAPPKG